MKGNLFLIFTMMGIAFFSVTLLSLGNNYHYKGYAELPLPQALEITSQYSEGSEIVTHSPTDQVYITYDFWEDKPSMYTLSGELDIGRVYGQWIILGLSLIIIISGIIGVILNRKEER